jgi:hypothetical protein
MNIILTIFQMVTELRDMLVERLLVYEKRNNFLPERIIVFRDGVSGECWSYIWRHWDLILNWQRVNLTSFFERKRPRFWKPLRN